MIAIVDPNVCIGCGLCIKTCPEVFRMQGGKAAAYVEPPSSAAKECAVEAAEICPVHAITVEQ